MKFPIEEFVGNYTLRILCQVLNANIFKEVAQNYCESLPLMYRNVVTEGEDKYAVSVENGMLACTCLYREKSGIPCCHLHKII